MKTNDLIELVRNNYPSDVEIPLKELLESIKEAYEESVITSFIEFYKAVGDYIFDSYDPRGIGIVVEYPKISLKVPSNFDPVVLKQFMDENFNIKDRFIIQKVSQTVYECVIRVEDLD